jgi:PII-like signaling protein
MPPSQAAKILRIHISEADRHGGKPLYQAIVAKCRELKIAGASVFFGLEGYGETAEMHKAHFVRSDRPVLITVVDAPDNIDRLIPAVTELMNTGLLAVGDARMIRVEKKPNAHEGTGA